MPFVECAARCFTAVSIQKNAPESSGVYGLANSREWLFVGETNNIRAHLLQHLREINTLLTRQNPTGFTFELSSPSERVARQQVLIRELTPRLGQTR